VPIADREQVFFDILQWRRNDFESGGHRSGAKVGRGTDPAQSAGKIYFWSCPSILGSKSTISRFGERFRDGQYSLVSFLFAVLLLTVSPVPHGVGGTDILQSSIIATCSP